MEITQQIRDWARDHGVDPEQARSQGMAERSEAFRAGGAALYRRE
jgi:phosphomethylpyrimidine synthase